MSLDQPVGTKADRSIYPGEIGIHQSFGVLSEIFSDLPSICFPGKEDHQFTRRSPRSQVCVSVKQEYGYQACNGRLSTAKFLRSQNTGTKYSVACTVNRPHIAVLKIRLSAPPRKSFRSLIPNATLLCIFMPKLQQPAKISAQLLHRKWIY